MTLVRGIGRTMLSSYFVLSGIRAVRHPEEFVQDAAPLTDRIVPTAKRFAPDQVGDFIPEDPATLVRVNGALQVAGGLALATGKGRRFGAGLLALSLIPTTLARHPFWTRTDPAEKADDRNQFIKNVSLLGGVIIASRDTEGKPGLTWRANETREAAMKRTRGAKKAARKAVKQARGNDAATAAIGSGLALVGEVVEESRKAKKQAAKRAKAAAERAQKEAKHARKQAKKTGAKLQKSAGRAQQRALDVAEDATKTVRKAAGEARSHLGEHIELGAN
jgi:uncharacterized membrane protein YphA (DoxX/SURF4 family)